MTGIRWLPRGHLFASVLSPGATCIRRITDAATGAWYRSQMGEALAYMRKHYGATWSRPHIVKLVGTGKLRGVQPGGEGGWWYISRESIDELLNTPKQRS